ncbi:DUF4139 domain-containing protein [Aliamphritea spongicola]|uniref:DUF4139 domain-containing protein n=1 Tax=Aliamphritea spongicola TaxID=707589 RepID=UPI00196AC061|nr:DUF4139 domain-containing protein [Aliamphritea spongicola]MBN3563366.1 DUF4139 domain-containing protein [Aliamphritea spongicola]
MHRFVTGVVSLLTPALTLAAGISIDASQQKSLTVTLYNDNLGLVRDTRQLPAIPAGESISVQDVSHQMMSETLRLENAGEVLEQNLNTNLISTQALLQHYIGKNLQVARTNQATGQETRFPARLLSFSGQLATIDRDGSIESIPVNSNGWRFIFPALPEGMQSKPSLEITTAGSKANREAVLTYLTRGLSWQMDYAMTLNQQGDRLSLDGLATLNNQTGVDFNNSNILLMAGQVNQPPQNLRYKQERGMMAMAMADGMESGQPQQLQDYQLYKLPRTTSLKTGQTKQVNLISSDMVKTEKTYRYRFPVYPGLDHNEYREKPAIELSFRNTADSSLGFPLPAGNARVFSPDNDNQLQFIGSARVEHTATGETVRLPIGKAFDLSIKRQQTDFEKVYNGHKMRQTLEVRNSRSTAAKVTLNADFSQDWKIEDSSHAYTKSAAGQAQWVIDIPGNGVTTVSFSVQLLQP